MIFLLILAQSTAKSIHTPNFSTDRLPSTFTSEEGSIFRLRTGSPSPNYSSPSLISCPKEDVDAPSFLRPKRFVTNVDKWDKTVIRWRFRDPYHLFKKKKDFAVVRGTIAHALKMWSTASKGALVFSDLSEEITTADIDIFFARWDHGDHEPFDGRGGIVAHSGYPKEGRVHFDASELWTINGSRGIDLRYVILHELGHALGLRHSHHRSAIMHPIYQSPHKTLALSDDDILGIASLYPTTTEKTHRPITPLL